MGNLSCKNGEMMCEVVGKEASGGSRADCRLLDTNIKVPCPHVKPGKQEVCKVWNLGNL